jgi:membrane-associated phospholipid phosphatase
MIRNIISFILRSRLENVIAAAVSIALLALFLTTRMFHSFAFGMHDFIFILLPISILGVKTLLGLLYSPEAEDGGNAGLSQFLGSFFRPFLKIFRDWFPFLLLSACYYSLFSNLMLRINPTTADAFLARIDAAVFGNQAAFLLEPMIHPWLTDFLNVIYFSFVLYLPGVALYFYVKKEERAFRRLMMGYLTLILLGVSSYLLVPAIGPEAYFVDKFTRNLQGQTLTRGVDFIMKSARVGHDCFPSLHVAIPLLLALYLRDYRRRAFVPALVYVALMCCATIYLRYHYVVDVAAAFVYAPAAYWLNDFVLARWPGERAVNVPAPPPPVETAGPVPAASVPPGPDAEAGEP